MIGRTRMGIAVALSTVVAATAAVATLSLAAEPNPICTSPTTPVHQLINPTTQVSLVTRSQSEADSARARYGFTTDLGTPFRAFDAPAAGLSPVIRLFNATSGDFLWTASGSEAAAAVRSHGYRQVQTEFYAPTAGASCTVAITRWSKGVLHRLAVPADAASLQAAGWHAEGTMFYALPGQAGPVTPTSPAASTSPTTPVTGPTPTSTSTPPTPSATGTTTSGTPTPSTLPLSGVLSGGVLGRATYTFRDFPVSKDGLYVGAVLPAGGLTGGGSASSVVQIVPGSSTRSGLVPPNDPAYTNPLNLLYAGGSASALIAPALRGFTLQGTAQGHVYNGLRLSYTKGARVSDVKVVAIPGNYHINPGETFGINDWQGHGNVYTGIEVDGAGVGASALGINSSDNVTVNGAYLHDNPYSAGIAAWKTTNVSLTDVRTVKNRTGLNFERVQGTVTITRPTFSGNAEQDLYIGSDYGSAKYTITDPVLDAGAKLRIRLPKNEMGAPNKQLKSDIRVIVKGVDVTASMVTWL